MSEKRPEPILYAMATKEEEAADAIVPLELRRAEDPSAANVWLHAKTNRLFGTLERAEFSREYETPGYRERQSARTDARRLAAATTVPAAEYGGWVYLDGYGHNEGYFESVDDLLEWVDCLADPGDDPPARPAWAFACSERGFEFDMEREIESVLQDYHEDAIHQLDGLDEILDAVRAWVARQTLVSYFADHKRVVVIDQVRFEAERAAAAALLEGAAS